MTDPFTSLHSPDDRADPDPGFRDELLDAARRRLAGDINAAPPRSQSDTVLIDMEDPDMLAPRRRRHRFLYIAAAVAAVAGLAIVALVRANDDDDQEPQSSAVPNTTQLGVATTVAPTAAPTIAPTTAAPTTIATTVPVFSDRNIAQRMMLTESGEFAPGWTLSGPSDPPEDLLQSAVASRIPACAPYIAPVFEAAEAAVVDNRLFYHPQPTEALFGQFVIVFPDEASAIAAFDAMSEPDFRNCAVAYNAVEHKQPESLGESQDEPPFPPLGDQMTFSAYSASWIHPVTGEPHGPETNYAVMIRVGRTITLTGALHIGDGGDLGDIEVVTQDQLQQMVARIVARAEAALAGEPEPEF